MPSFRHRLTSTQRHAYDRSEATPSIALRATTRVRQAVETLPATLRAADRQRVEATSQVIADEITSALRVPSVRVLVQGSRPSNTRGELHGLYTASNGRGATIKIWMITAKRGQVVAFRTFLRTLLHEICHHLDYGLLRLTESFHTDGFYKRESSLFYQIGGPAAFDNTQTAVPRDQDAPLSRSR